MGLINCRILHFFWNCFSSDSNGRDVVSIVSDLYSLNPFSVAQDQVWMTPPLLHVSYPL